MAHAMLLRRNIHQFSGLRGAGLWSANVFLLLGDGVTVVDTGLRGRRRRILREVARLGYRTGDIANIIITHHHIDHVGGLAALKRTTGAVVFAHPADIPYIEGRLPQPVHAPRWLRGALSPLQPLWTPAPAAVDIPVRDGDVLPVLGGTVVLHTPGHTPGSICLLVKRERLLIVGDVLSHTIGLRIPPRILSFDMQQEARSARRIAGLDYDIVGFGHGPPMLHGAQQEIARFAAKVARNDGP